MNTAKEKNLNTGDVNITIDFLVCIVVLVFTLLLGKTLVFLGGDFPMATKKKAQAPAKKGKK